MKQVTLFHNPAAGDEEHSKNELVALMEKNGFECRYLSTKDKEWKDFDSDTDLLVIAGGDGTVRKVTKNLLDRKLNDTVPIALLPLGTANNIAKTLGIAGKTSEIISSWVNATIKKFDIGIVKNLPDAEFFLESFGYGIFPYLMSKMKKLEDGSDTPAESMKNALKQMHEIVVSYSPKYCELEVDGTDHSGNFLLAEIMNTRSIGPNLVLSPLADAGDGELEVILVPEKHTEKFAQYVLDEMNDVETTYQFHTLRGRDIHISWEGTHVHVDDEILKLEKSAKAEIKIKSGLLEFLVPGNDKSE